MRPIERITPHMVDCRDQFLRLVCDEMHLNAIDVMSRKRTSRLTMARHIIIWGLHRYTDATSTQIGHLMMRDHATVLYAIGAVEDNLPMPYHEELRKIINLVAKKGGVMREEMQ